MGFLRSRNRVVVALSRAQRGLYIFGNALTIAGQETENGPRPKLWMPILLHLLNEERFASSMPIVCSKHQNLTYISEPEHWEDLSGGCYEPCGGIFSCGHLCPHKCHPTKHDDLICKEPCEKTLICGHGCSKNCGEACRCDECHVFSRFEDLDLESSPNRDLSEDNNSQQAWRDTPPLQDQVSRKQFFFETPARPMQYRLNSPNTAPLSEISGQTNSRNTSYAFAFPSTENVEVSPEKGHEAWNTWDPSNADEEFKREGSLRKKPMKEGDIHSPDELVFTETHKPVVSIAGQRILGPKAQQVVRRVASINEIEPAAISEGHDIAFTTALDGQLLDLNDSIRANFKIIDAAFTAEPDQELLHSSNEIGATASVNDHNTAFTIEFDGKSLDSNNVGDDIEQSANSDGNNYGFMDGFSGELPATHNRFAAAANSNGDNTELTTGNEYEPHGFSNGTGATVTSNGDKIAHKTGFFNEPFDFSNGVEIKHPAPCNGKTTTLVASLEGKLFKFGDNIEAMETSNGHEITSNSGPSSRMLELSKDDLDFLEGF